VLGYNLVDFFANSSGHLRSAKRLNCPVNIEMGFQTHTWRSASAHRIPKLQPGRPAGLPDGLFSNQNFQFGSILESLAMEDVGVFYVHLVYFTANWYIFGHFV
jgi:hypothetical protein